MGFVKTEKIRFLRSLANRRCIECGVSVCFLNKIYTNILFGKHAHLKYYQSENRVKF